MSYIGLVEEEIAVFVKMILDPFFMLAFFLTVFVILLLILLMIVVLVTELLEDWKKWKKRRSV